MLAAWWIYERSTLPDGDGLITFVMVMAGLGAGAVIVHFVYERITALL